MVHKPKHKVHSFRGLLSDGGQDEINLERSNVTLAYRITKFEIMPQQPGAVDYESGIMVWREDQGTISTAALDIDFSDPDLLAAGYIILATVPTQGNNSGITIFDNILFSRNIFVTHTNIEGSGAAGKVNYYVELEEVPVGAATLTQLKLGVARKLNLSENPPDA